LGIHSTLLSVNKALLGVTRDFLSVNRDLLDIHLTHLGVNSSGRNKGFFECTQGSFEYTFVFFGE